MKSKNFKLFVVLIPAVFVAALIYLAAGVYADKKEGPVKAQARFEDLISKTAVTASNFEPGTMQFSAQFIRDIGQIDDFAALKLVLNGATIYSYPREGLSGPAAEFVSTFSKTFSTKYGNTLELSASVYILKTESIYSHARVSFLLILIGTVAAALILLLSDEKSQKSEENGILSLKKKIASAEKSGRFSKKTADEDSIEFVDENIDEASQLENPVEENVTLQEEEEAVESPAENSGELKEDDYDEEIDLQFSDATDYEDSFEKDGESSFNALDDDLTIEEYEETSESQANENSPEAVADADSDTQGEILEQSKLYENLTGELTKASENNEDLSVIVLKIENLDRGNLVSKKIVGLLKEKIATKGSIYAFNTDSYALTLNDTALDGAFATASELQSQISEILKSESMENIVTLGVAARTSRNLDGKTLVTEALQAQKHAEEDPSSAVVAFRVNPEKYRQYVQNA